MAFTLGRQVGQNWNLANIERIEVLRGRKVHFMVVTQSVVQLTSLPNKLVVSL